MSRKSKRNQERRGRKAITPADMQQAMDAVGTSLALPDRVPLTDEARAAVQAALADPGLAPDVRVSFEAALREGAVVTSGPALVPAVSTIKTVTFLRLFTCDNSTYVAEGDDGKTWTFTTDGNEWDVCNDVERPDTARGMDVETWDATGLPLTLDIEVPADTTDAGVDVRNTVELPGAGGQPSEAAVVTTPEPPSPLATMPKQSGFKRVGTTVPFVVVPCDLVVPVIRLRTTTGKAAVKYEREEETRNETPNADGNDKTEKVITRTTRTITAVDEYKAMDALRARMRNRVKANCVDTIIGWLSPRENRADLRKTIVQVEAEIIEVNAGATFYKVSPGVVVASIETDADVAAATVTETLRDAMDGLREAFARGDIEGMRAIAAGLKGFDALVNDEAADKVREAIDEARKIARTVVRETEKKGRALEEVLAELSTDAIDAARFMLIAREGAVKADDGEALPEVDGRTLELAPVVDLPEAATLANPPDDAAPDAEGGEDDGDEDDKADADDADDTRLSAQASDGSDGAVA